jgi:hypothetical protein
MWKTAVAAAALACGVGDSFGPWSTILWDAR